MEKPMFFTVSWSLNCRKAEHILNKAHFAFEKVELNSPDLISSVSREFGIHKLPALKVNGKTHEGLKAVKEVVTTLRT
jgi:hypothetical protein